MNESPYSPPVPRHRRRIGGQRESGRALGDSSLTVVPTQKERNAETRRRLLSAAREAFAENGYANATVADIVKRAGRSHGSFYLHFTNKEAALQALLEDAMAQLSLQSKTMWRWDEPGTSVHKTVRRFIEEFGENRDLWLLLDQRSSLEPTFKKLSDQWFQQLAGSIMRGMVSTETPGLMRGLDPGILAQVFAAMLSDSTRAAYQENHSWTTDELADEISAIWSRTLGYTDMPPQAT
ncbi:TetR/AcrR family transcriptional regulator [Nocardia sp. CA-129566]|uniref:TetR/AcrR family transcriptional regulator n=1 Tax=Nocardia sp. CA-129566 TaxID=3239976 RepID=UPI003D9672EC